MTSTKVEEIRSWSTPEKVVDVQSFMGFANVYRRFIKGFSKIAKPLTDLTRKGIQWAWTPSCQDAFDTLKEMFTTGPILTHFDDTRPTKLETDASDFGLGAVLSQLCEDETSAKKRFTSGGRDPRPDGLRPPYASRAP